MKIILFVLFQVLKMGNKHPFLTGLILTVIVAFVAWVCGKSVTQYWKNYRRLNRFSFADLCKRLDLPADKVRAFRPTYQETFLPKKSGGKRRLLVPDPDTKAMQRLLLRRVFNRLKAHPAAMGFERGKSIVHNAWPHVGQRVVVRCDLVDFFPNTRAERISQYFRDIGWTKEAADWFVRACCWEGGLPQGAPTSPRLSNLVNRVMDYRLTRYAALIRGAYTRYADDLTISVPWDRSRRIRGILQKIRRTAAKFGYQVHRDKKLSIRRQHQPQLVTGLIVNAGVNLPRKTRRLLRAVRHRLKVGRKPTLSRSQLEGMEAFQKMVARQAEEISRNIETPKS